MNSDRLTRNPGRRHVGLGQVRSATPPAAITRPPKSGGTTEYVTEVALGHDIIRDNEVDGDLDTVFAGHNALVAAFNALVPTIPTIFPVAIGPSAPPAPAVGQLWWRTTDGNLYVYYDDGTTAQWVPAMASVGKLIAGQYYLLAGASPGVPTASLSVGLYVAALAFTLPANLAGSQAVAKIAATAATAFSVQVNGVAKGTISWASGATLATFAWPAAVAIAAGDRVEILAPAAPDATLSDPAWTLRGAV
jgi:hypothetical protein